MITPEQKMQKIVEAAGECSVVGCEKEIKTRGMCGKHYKKFMKYGDPLFVVNTRGLTHQEKLDFYTVKKDGCWSWSGLKTEDGYGSIYINGKMVGAHRLSYQLNRGVIPKGLCVLHGCDNPECTNPQHLFVGTQRENIDDMLTKGRSSRGGKQRKAKLSEEDVSRVRKMILDGSRIVDIADKFKVAPTTISEIKSGRNWGWLQ